MAQSQGQTEVFEKAKQSIATELNREILVWDYSQMISALAAVIARKNPNTKSNGSRYFCRHYLGMHGDSYNEMRRWLSGEAEMPFEKIQLVLRVLKSEGDGSLAAVPPNKGGSRGHHQKKEIKAPSHASEVRESKPEPPTPKVSGAIRKFIDHTTTLLNSLMILGVEIGVSPDDLYDGDRIQIRMAAKQIFDAFGIDVVFPESKAAHSQPVTRQDFAEIGLLTQRRKKRS